MDSLINKQKKINESLKRYGVKFGIYKNNTFHEQLVPFDCILIIITKEEFDDLNAGLIQRVKALNLFLYDIYHDKNIIKDNVIPSEFIYSGSGYLLP